MRKLQRAICMILCAMLCITGCGKDPNTDQTAGGQPAVSAVQMLDFNKDLTRVDRDDKYRTTYEIFVYSFCDSNGDGIGDLNGIRSKLDYIQDLGFDAIWLTPVHPSSTYHKYDVDDYYAIDPVYGTLEDYEALLQECHDRGIRVYMDLVLNHTSDDNAWFKAASDYLHELPSGWEPDTSYCKYYDYYNFTRQPSDGYAHLEGTEWYYEARFWSEMPDLNLSSEAVRGEIRDIMAFWLGKGVDGFRLDAVKHISADFYRDWLQQLRNQTGRELYAVGEYWNGDLQTLTEYLDRTEGKIQLFDVPFHYHLTAASRSNGAFDMRNMLKD